MESYSSETEKYFDELVEGVKKEYVVANLARAKGLDPRKEVEIPLAMTLAEKVVGLISTVYPQISDRRIIDRILELEQQYGQLDTAVSFKIAEEVAEEKYCKFKDRLEAIDAAVRIGFAYTTLGVVSSPIEGFTGIKIAKTEDGKEYFQAYFSGPIRSAGTTASCVVLMLIDYLREHFGYARYDPTEKEVKRYVTENYDYHERINNLQYLPTEEEIAFLAKNIPIQIAGEPTEKLEVSNYKDLPRVETNFIRGGMCLCFSEGLAQKAQKGLRLWRATQAKGFQMTGWTFLDDYIILHKKREKGTADSSPTYIKDLVAGRPVFGHPSRSGAFRFRYGRSRSCGFSATSIHPATMAISDDFLSAGTQLKIERPTKGCIIMSCDSIEGPIVKLSNGSVVRVNTYEEGKKLYKDIQEIIYFGDILFPLGDVINRNYELLKAGYVPEWWFLELKKKAKEKGETLDINKGSRVLFNEAVEYSRRFEIPLHPDFIFFWTQLNKEQFLGLLDFLQQGVWRGDRLVLPYEKSLTERFAPGKRALELLGAEHEVFLDNLVISKCVEGLLFNLGIENPADGELLKEKILPIYEKIAGVEMVLDAVNLLSSAKIKDRAGTFIGTRMGRPEKAKLRRLTGSPSVLFPVGDEGGRMRNFMETVKTGKIKGDFPMLYCKKCDKETIYSSCEVCGEETQRKYYCKQCDMKMDQKCEHERVFSYSNREIDPKHYLESATTLIGFRREEIPELIKGVRGTSNEGHDIENLAKGILRAKHNLAVNKDGTIRYDCTEIPISHFKPSEIGASVERLQKLGYNLDAYGKQFTSQEQILELKPHDVILPACPESPDERADDVFFNIANFIDDLLERVYKLPRYYNLKKKEDLIGHLIACMAPHNCAGVIGRIIGFAKPQGLMASPYMHAAMRRDCDGDEAAAMLLLDVLINFSRKFLPAHRGGTQDAPLVLNSRIRAGEVDDQILDFELVWDYPLELYTLAEQGKHSSEIKIETVKNRLKEGKDNFINTGFTHDTTDFNTGVVNSSYKSLPSMKEKVWRQMELVKKLRAVDSADVARLIIERHFIRDIRGNLRKFAQQQFRCVTCNEKFRRPPMIGVCNKCGGKILFTISEGSIVKYLEPALDLANNFDVPAYTKQGLELAKVYIQSIFGKEETKQIELKKWF
jgi:DNA polymerase II large subunit